MSGFAPERSSQVSKVKVGQGLSGRIGLILKVSGRSGRQGVRVQKRPPHVLPMEKCACRVMRDFIFVNQKQ